MPGPRGVPGPGGGVESTPPPTATAAGGMHPTGMHSCLFKILGSEIFTRWFVGISMSLHSQAQVLLVPKVFLCPLLFSAISSNKSFSIWYCLSVPTTSWYPHH